MRDPSDVALVSAMAIIAVGVGIGVADVGSHRQPAPIAAAVTAARAQTLASRGPSTRPAPDLSIQGLALVMGERVDLGGLMSDALKYRSEQGEAVFLFMSGSPFPEPRGATAHRVGGSGWQSLQDGMTLVSGDRPADYLVVAEDPSLVGPVEHMIVTEAATAG